MADQFMHRISSLRSLEILDSRGRPTLKTWCRLENGTEASASVPSGASTGTSEAAELRDGDFKRHRGLGCLKAVANVAGAILHGIATKDSYTQSGLDEALVRLDGTSSKKLLGANAILSVSLAFARAAAASEKIELHKYFAQLGGFDSGRMPGLTINLFSGGKHAGGQAAIQDVLMVPRSSRSVREGLEMATAVYHYAAEISQRRYGMRLLRADEGGQAPPFLNEAAMIEGAMEAIESAGLKPGVDMALAVDAASTQFFKNGIYEIGGRQLTSVELISMWESWMRTYPIISLEDGLAEEDWLHWPTLRSAISDRCAVMGDDLLCTNPERIRKAIALKAANALLLKVNQIGTVSEALEALKSARGAGWHVTVSARSGETEDDWLADLAVGWKGDWIKIGSITQSERLAKYNRLLEIESAERV